MTMTNDCVDLRRPGRPVGKVPPCVLVLVAPSVFGQEAATPCPDCLGAGLQICLPFPEGESVCSEGSCVHVKSPIFCLELCFRKRDLAAKIQKGSDLWDSATCLFSRRKFCHHFPWLQRGAGCQRQASDLRRSSEPKKAGNSNSARGPESRRSLAFMGRALESSLMMWGGTACGLLSRFWRRSLPKSGFVSSE